MRFLSCSSLKFLVFVSKITSEVFVESLKSFRFFSAFFKRSFILGISFEIKVFPAALDFFLKSTLSLIYSKVNSLSSKTA